MAKQKQSQKEAPVKEISKPKATKVTGSWARNYYIRGHGHVKVGDAVTKEALAAWNNISNAKPQIEA